MEFDKSRVYTALNADELKVGSKVILADAMKALKTFVATGEANAVTITHINSEEAQYRFHSNECEFDYPLAYLVEEPEEKVLKWTDLKPLDVIKHKNYNDTAVVTRLCVSPYGADIHVLAGGDWLKDDELKEWEKVEE